MILKRLKGVNLYGYLTREIDFEDDINILVGINGSGKTSILNLLNWLLTPSIPDLCSNYFDSAELSFEFEDMNFIIKAEHVESSLRIIVNNEKETLPEILVDERFYSDPREIDSQVQMLRYREGLLTLNPDENEIKTYNFINVTIPKPIVIGLDRNLYTEEGSVRTYSRERQHSGKVVNENTPVDYVKSLANNKYREFKKKSNKFDDQLRDELVFTSFDDPLVEKSLTSHIEIDINEIELFEDKVNAFFESDLINRDSILSPKRFEEFQKRLRNYFKTLKSQIKKEEDSSKNDLNTFLLISNYNQFKKIKYLVGVFDRIEKKKKLARKQIDTYLNTINSFLNDSKKELYFDDISSRLYFRIIFEGTKKETSKKKLTSHNLENLSSGEKQILILFTFIMLSQEKGKIFIIDEPELSLHPKWQSSFLEKIQNILPDQVQLIFASHSPLIVSNNDNFIKLIKS